MLERERIMEIVAAVSAVALMIGVMYGVGLSYGGDDGGLAAEGGEILVGVIAGFVVLLTFVGAGLAYALNDPEAGLESDSEESEDAEATSAA